MILAKEVVIAFCGGIFSAVLTIGFCPLIEVVFRLHHRAKLLELANLDQPLIKKLMIEAPGTYNHSVIVATLRRQPRQPSMPTVLRPRSWHITMTSEN